jgi:hypothetical protein
VEIISSLSRRMILTGPLNFATFRKNSLIQLKKASSN